MLCKECGCFLAELLILILVTRFSYNKVLPKFIPMNSDFGTEGFWANTRLLYPKARVNPNQ